MLMSQSSCVRSISPSEKENTFFTYFLILIAAILSVPQIKYQGRLGAFFGLQIQSCIPNASSGPQRYCVCRVGLGLRLGGQTALSGCTEICDCIFNTSSIYRLYWAFVFSEYCSQTKHFVYLFTQLIHSPSFWKSTLSRNLYTRKPVFFINVKRK